MEKYYQKIQDRDARPLLKRALSLYGTPKAGDIAYDLGCGIGQEAYALYKHGFDIHTVDISERAFDYMADHFPELAQNAQKIVSAIENIAPHMQATNFINASYALPFIDKEKFEKTMQELLAHIKTDGIFCGNFFGPNDGWADSKSICTISEVKAHLQEFDILYLHEYEEDMAPTTGGMKHWHLIDVIARKK